jgi:hypothetical protein
MCLDYARDQSPSGELACRNYLGSVRIALTFSCAGPFAKHGEGSRERAQSESPL